MWSCYLVIWLELIFKVLLWKKMWNKSPTSSVMSFNHKPESNVWRRRQSTLVGLYVSGGWQVVMLISCRLCRYAIRYFPILIRDIAWCQFCLHVKHIYNINGRYCINSSRNTTKRYSSNNQLWISQPNLPMEPCKCKRILQIL